MTEKNDEDRDAILKELHQDESASSEDEELDLSKLKKQVTLKKQDTKKPTPEKEKPKEEEVNDKDDSNPLGAEQKRHKDNLMADIYDQISDEDDEEEESKEINTDNPFQQKLIQEAKELKLKQIEQRLEDKNQEAGGQGQTSQKMMGALKGYFQQAKDKATTTASTVSQAMPVKLSDDMKGKLSNVQTTVSSGASSISSGISQINNTEGGLLTKVNLAANQAAEKINKMQNDYETKVNLDEFLSYEDQRIEQDKIDQPEVEEQKSPGHFVIADDDEDPETIVLAEKKKKKQEDKKVEDKPKGDGETFDESSDEEEKKEKSFLEKINQMKVPELAEKKVNFRDMMKKASRHEVLDIEKLRLTRKLFVVNARKEVKNSSLVRNLVSVYEDRFLAVVNFKDPNVADQKNQYHLVVLKQVQPQAVQTKKLTKQIYGFTKDQIKKQYDEYNQTNQNLNSNPYATKATDNPYGAMHQQMQEQAPVTEAMVGQELPEQEEESILDRPHWMVKSVHQLERIFMIDITSKGIFKVQLELIMHFVNESRNPGSLPKIKKYALGVGLQENTDQQQFLRDLEKLSIESSEYYRKLKSQIKRK